MLDCAQRQSSMARLYKGHAAGAVRCASPQGITPMRIVHHLENSRSLRVLWMLEELGLDYELRRYPRAPKTLLAPPELRSVHPLGKSPVLQDGELVLAESGAILDYLADRYDTQRDRKSTRLNSSHGYISYAVF